MLYIKFVQKNSSVSASRNPGMCLQMCVPEQIPNSAEHQPCQRIEFWIDPYCVARVSDESFARIRTLQNFQLNQRHSCSWHV